MIASTNPPSAADWMIWALAGWWVEKPTNFALPDFLIASIALANSWLLANAIGLVGRMVVAEGVDEEEVDVVGLQGRQPLVEHPHHLGRRSWARSLVARKMFLRTSGIAWSHLAIPGSVP